MSLPNFLATESCHLTGHQRYRAARAAAASAVDAADLAVLLDMLGLSAQDGEEEPHDPEPEADSTAVPDHHREIGAELALCMLSAVRHNRQH